MSTQTKNIIPQIYSLLLKAGMLTRNAIYEALHIESTTIDDALEIMEKEGYITHIDGKYIALPKIIDVLKKIDEIREKLANIKKNIDNGFDYINSKLDNSYNGILGAIKERVDTLLSAINNSINELTARYREAINKNLVLLTEFSKSLTQISNALHKNIELFSTTKGTINQNLKDIQNLMLSEANEEIVLLRSETQKIIKNLEQESMGITSKNISDLKAAIDTATTSIIKDIKDITKTMKDFLSKIDSLLEDTSIKVNSIIQDINKTFSEITESIPERTVKNISDTFLAGINKIGEEIQNNKDRVIGQINTILSKEVESLKDLRTNLTNIVQEMDNMLSTILDEFLKKTQELVKNIFEDSTKRVGEAKDTLLSGAKRLIELSENSISTIKSLSTNSMTQLKEILRTMISEKIMRDIEALQENIKLFDKTIDAISNKIKETIENYKSNAEKFNSSVAELISSLRNLISMRLDSVNKIISGSMRDIETAADQKVIAETISRQVIEAFNGYIEKLVSVLVEANNTVLTELKDTITKKIDNILATIEGKSKSATKKDLNRKIEEISASLQTIKNYIEEQTKTKQNFIKTMVTENIEIMSKGMADIIANSLSTATGKIRDTIYGQIKDLQSLMSNEIIWIKSEVESRIKIFLDKQTTRLNELMSDLEVNINNTIKTISAMITEKTALLDKATMDLRDLLSSFRDTYFSQIDTINAKLNSDIEASFKSFSTALNNNITRVAGVFDGIASAISSSQEYFINSLKSEFDRLSAGFKSEVDKEMTEIMKEIENYDKKMDSAIAIVINNVDAGFGLMKQNIDQALDKLRDTLTTKILGELESLSTELQRIIQQKGNEITKLINSLRENIQEPLFTDIKTLDAFSVKINTSFGEIGKLADDTAKKIDDSLSSTYTSIKENLLNSVQKLQSSIDNSISMHLGELNMSYDKTFGEIQQELTQTREILDKKLIQRHEANVATINKTLNSFEENIKGSIDSATKPLQEFLEEIDKILEEEKKSTTTEINGIQGRVQESIEKILEDANSIPRILKENINKYIDALKNRPKGAFVVYGLEIVFSIIRDFISRTKNSLTIVAPILDENIKSIVKSTPKNIIVELYTSSTIAEDLENVFIYQIEPTSNKIYLVGKDSDEAVLILEGETGQYIGAIFEGKSATSILSGLVSIRKK